MINERADTFAASAGTFQERFNRISCVRQNNVSPQQITIKRKSLLNQPIDANTVVNVYNGSIYDNYDRLISNVQKISE